MRSGFRVLHSVGKLLQQFAVDACTRVEANRMQFLHQRQALFRAGVTEGLADLVRGASGRQTGRAGGIIHRQPAGRAGAPIRHGRCRQAWSAGPVHDIHGNPRWEELTDNLGPRQRVERRPDVVVFSAKSCAP